ncbi:MAG: 3-dehydroquinate synthase [Clostridia bacterium]|nr:3-dehydroquinate synthase [Clostridia bacterium]
MKELLVKAKEREYKVVIEKDFSLLSQKVKEVFGGKLAVVYDENTHALFSNEITQRLKDFQIFEIVFPAGENTKSLQSYAKLLSFLADNKFTRGDGILAVGGGVIGDLCGFVASSYMRGICYMSCPTTLLSCVDSSIGGKTAVNLPEGKNLVGAFYAPSLVYVSLSAFDSLPEREIECGMGEIVKYAFLDGSMTASDIKNGDREDLVLKSLKIKKKVVENDEFDRGERAKLNLGHTVGHAVESLSSYAYSHGLCVAKGIDKIIDISCKYYGYNDDKKGEFSALLNSYKFDLDIEFSTEEILEKITVDKKAETGAVNLVLIKDIANVEVVKLPFERIKELF